MRENPTVHLQRHPEEWFIADEIARAMGLTRSQVSQRLRYEKDPRLRRQDAGGYLRYRWIP